MSMLSNIVLMTYLIFVSIVGTLGNGVILFAYGNRWNSSKSTSVVFILILACFDLCTCLIVVPTIAIMEYRDFNVPTFICRFYSFSKNLIIISSFIMSFVALDRFLNIALPHSRLLNPRRVKVLLILFISIGIGLGTLTALAFSTQPNRKQYIATYDLVLATEPFLLKSNTNQVYFEPTQNVSVLSDDIIGAIIEQITIPDGANITIIGLEYESTLERCFADTSIISETVRQVLKHISNKFFFVSIGIVTIFYTITFILALQRQKPRIRALKKSLNILNKFDTKASIRENSKSIDSSVTAHTSVIRSSTHSTCFAHNNNSSICKLGVAKPTILSMNHTQHPDENTLISLGKTSSISIQSNMNQQYEMSNIGTSSDVEEPLSSSLIQTKDIQSDQKQDSEHENHISISDGTSDDLGTCTEKLNGTKQVSFLVQIRRDTTKPKKNRHSSVSSNSLDDGLDENHDIYYKFPCPCSKTRQLLIKFHFSRPSSHLNRWFCCCSLKKRQLSKQTPQHHGSAVPITMEDETTAQQAPLAACSSASSSHSETLRRQLHQHRLKQIRMALTFLFITVSFVLFYLPSILIAERIIKSSMLVYYLYLCTHALNPVIYCFMHPSLRAYVLSMCRCCGSSTKRRSQTGAVSIFER